MKSQNSNWWIWLLIFFGVTAVGGLGPLLLIIGVILAITFASVESSKKQTQNRRPYRRTTSSRKGYSSSEIAKINIYLRNWYRSNTDIALTNNVALRLRGSRYASLASLDVYQNGSYVCALSDFETRFPGSYREIINELTRMATGGNVTDSVVDVNVSTPVEKPKPQPKKTETPKEEEKTSQYYITKIDGLNDNIPDEEISNGLFETTSLLKQIKVLEQKFPKSKSKLDKLYEYYLPILVRILGQYDALQTATYDSSYEETRQKLSRTVILINEAMRKIITSMTDQDFINLSADISTLEAVLQKDGLTEDGQLSKEG